MSMLFVWIPVFVLSYALIYFSADYFIDALKDLSRMMKVSPFLIGLLILGIDPEESIASVMAAINGLPYIAIGNVIGNSIISIAFCFSLPALFYKVKFDKISSYYPILMIFGVILILLNGILLSFNLLMILILKGLVFPKLQ